MMKQTADLGVPGVGGIVAPDEADLRAEIVAETRARFRLYVVSVAVVSLVVGGLVGFYGLGGGAGPASGFAPPPSLLPPPSWTQHVTPASGVTVTPGWLRVYVSGAVSSSRVVTVPPGSLVADALKAAGGPRASADLNALNLAAPLADHQHVVVPELQPAACGAPKATTGAGTAKLMVNINTASAPELEALPHIGATRAADIVAYREANGPFAHIEELQNVPGIGPAIYETLAPLITIGP